MSGNQRRGETGVCLEMLAPIHFSGKETEHKLSMDHPQRLQESNTEPRSCGDAHLTESAEGRSATGPSSRSPSEEPGNEEVLPSGSPVPPKLSLLLWSAMSLQSSVSKPGSSDTKSSRPLGLRSRLPWQDCRQLPAAGPGRPGPWKPSLCRT